MNNKFLSISGCHGIYLLPYQNIVRLEAKGSQTVIHDTNGKKHWYNKNIGELKKMLSQHNNFFRVHKSHIINVDKMKVYKPNPVKGGVIIMECNTPVPVSKRIRSSFNRMLK